MDEPMDEPAMDAEPEMDLDVDVDEEEPMMETGLDEEESFGAGIADAAGKESEVEADKAFMEEETLEEEELEEMEDDGAHSALIDAIAAKVAERLLAEAKKTNK